MYDYYDYGDVYREMFGGSSVTSNLVSFALFVLMIVALWRIFDKAGEHGWASLIPFYKDYVLYKVSGKKNLFWGFLICSILSIGAVAAFAVLFFVIAVGVLNSALYYDPSDDVLMTYGFVVIVAGLVLVVCGILCLVFRAMQCAGLAKSFGVSGGYAVGLFFLPHIFYSILAFSKDKVYYGPDGMNTNNPYGYNQPYGQNYYGQQGMNQQYYGQPQYGQPNYGQPQYGQPNYGQPQYGQPQYDPNYGQPQQAAPQYDPNYGQPQQAAPQYDPNYGQPQQAAPQYDPNYGQPQQTTPQYDPNNGQPQYPHSDNKGGDYSAPED